MAKCKICSEKLVETFLGKLKGTIVKKAGSKKHYNVCPNCQKKFPGKDELMAEIK
jgi:hypothetical protein